MRPSHDAKAYNEAFERAPAAIRALLESLDIAPALAGMYERHGITERRTALSVLVADTLVGIVPLKQFVARLTQDGELDAGTARALAMDIRREVFAHVAHDLAPLQTDAEKNVERAQREEGGETGT
ncbi:MAG: hypothetical protein WD850_01730 [Candidatus Spechtbacterales bacterium]